MTAHTIPIPALQCVPKTLPESLLRRIPDEGKTQGKTHPYRFVPVKRQRWRWHPDSIGCTFFTSSTAGSKFATVGPTDDFSQFIRIDKHILAGTHSLSCYLKSVQMDISSVADVLEILRVSPALEQLTANIHLPEPLSGEDVTVSQAHNLSRLSLKFDSGEDHAVKYLLDRIQSSPALEELSIEISETEDDDSLPCGIAEFLQRSGASLTRFSIRAKTAVSEGEILECLRLSPRLKHLRLEDWAFTFTSEILGALTPEIVEDIDTDTVHVCPVLESVVFEGCRLGNLAEHVYNLIVSRWWVSGISKSQLREVILVDSGLMEEIMEEEEILACIEEGLVMKVSNSNSFPHGVRLVTNKIM